MLWLLSPSHQVGVASHAWEPLALDGQRAVFLCLARIRALKLFLKSLKMALVLIQQLNSDKPCPVGGSVLISPELNSASYN